MSRYISKTLRKKVATCAGFRCEYCRLPEAAAMIRFQIEHIISLQHGGTSKISNLAYACPICNANKGPNVGTVIDEGETFVPFFNPRRDEWHGHFEVIDGLIMPKSDIGRGTLKILKFNTEEKVLERMDLIDAGLFP